MKQKKKQNKIRGFKILNGGGVDHCEIAILKGVVKVSLIKVNSVWISETLGALAKQMAKSRFQAEATSRTKVLRWQWVWCAQGRARGWMWLSEVVAAGRVFENRSERKILWEQARSYGAWWVVMWTLALTEYNEEPLHKILSRETICSDIGFEWITLLLHRRQKGDKDECRLTN